MKKGEAMQENQIQGKRGRKKRKRSENRILAGSILLCIVTLTAVTICLIMLFQYRALQQKNAAALQELEAIRLEEEAAYSQEEVDALIETAVAEAEEKTGQEVSDAILTRLKALMASGESTTDMLRSFFPEEIVVADAGKYYFFPILEELAKNTYDPEAFEPEEDGVMHYYEDGERISHKGIDVSRYQDAINWSRVADDEVEYAFIRLGIRGYTTGEIMEDESFQRNIEGALKNDIDVGVYFFTQATSVEEAEEEAEFVIESIAPYKVRYPVVLDVEAVSSEARANDLPSEERTKYCIAFCEKIREAGYTPMIYGNLKTFMLMLNITKLEEYDKWFAYYDESYYFPYDFTIWQYTNKGRVSGISGDVDLNISFSLPEEW
ncbi:MAG: glycoside hydrolase family 25 protein [Bacteroidales bacterium]|nr:glycoside hydrolase family 25 protein [Bacteroidales bacterium]MCM1415195.1 glycoside hydrolase family 25 protein [bacterium]MCM1424949.1 glycoside hydrolase family 25 protein [bacterium]